MSWVWVRPARLVGELGLNKPGLGLGRVWGRWVQADLVFGLNQVGSSRFRGYFGCWVRG